MRVLSRVWEGVVKEPGVIGWENWLGSEDGKKCAAGVASGEYLENRLWRAYMSGWGDGLGRAIDKLQKINEISKNA